MSANKLCWICREEMEKGLISNIFSSDHCHCNQPEEKPMERKIDLDKIILVREGAFDMSLKHGHEFLLAIRPGGIIRMRGLEFKDLPVDSLGRILFKE